MRVRAVRSRAGRVVYLCSARLHREALEDVTDPTSIVDPGDLTHSQSHTITLACLYAYAYNAVLRAPSMHPNVHVCACALPWIWKCLSIKNGWPTPLLGSKVLGRFDLRRKYFLTPGFPSGIPYMSDITTT